MAVTAGLVSLGLLAATLTAPSSTLAGSTRGADEPVSFKAKKGKGNKSRVACYKDFFPGPGDEPVFRKRPRKCIFINRGASDLASTVDTEKVKWKKWGRKRAKGKGKTFVAMMAPDNYFTVRIKLSKPVKRCDRRVFSKAKFRIPKLNSKGSIRLDTC